jgi:hypothetical protein
MKIDWLDWMTLAGIYTRWAAGWLTQMGRSPLWRRLTLRK